MQLTEQQKKAIVGRIFAKYDSWKELADKLGIDDSTISRNKSKMSDKFLADLQKKADIELGDILFQGKLPELFNYAKVSVSYGFPGKLIRHISRFPWGFFPK